MTEPGTRHAGHRDITNRPFSLFIRTELRYPSQEIAISPAIALLSGETMDNTTRSERSRQAVIQAALDIIVRDGPGRLTLDAIARESGISKGGLMHQFHNKEAVLKALIEYQVEYYENFSRNLLAELGPDTQEPCLKSQIAISREVIAKPKSVFFGILGAMAQEPSLLSLPRETDAEKVESIRSEASDPDLALLRWAAARGLALTSMLGMCPLSNEDRERLFDRLLDGAQWQGTSACTTPAQDNTAGKAKARKTRTTDSEGPEAGAPAPRAAKTKRAKAPSGQ